MFGKRITVVAADAASIAPAAYASDGDTPVQPREPTAPPAVPELAASLPIKHETPAQGGSSRRSQGHAAVQRTIQSQLYERVDGAAAARLPRDELLKQVVDLIGEIVIEQKLSLASTDQSALARAIVDDMVGLGPLEELLNDESITDIMVNRPDQIYVERRGKLHLTEVRFRDRQHVMNIAQRIVTRIGRRVDETCPICDARLADGSRVNVIAPPLAIDGCTISIRKFSNKKITLDIMDRQNNLSSAMAKVLKIAAACRLNIVISGGTGSGKTTMLNAMSQLIDPGERVVTIEDAAELQLQQPHVVRLETRPPNIEGHGEILMRDLVKNALRMRPDRIICGEVRGPEAMDMLQAMNTGHDGSMCTLHANNPREAMSRLENMIIMAVGNLPQRAIRSQIAGAINLIIQVSRMRDGVRRITHISEIVGMEGEIITMQDLFTFEYHGENRDGTLIGNFKSTQLRPYFAQRAAYFGLERALIAAMTSTAG
jgi:pilus assembly protein CpaF